MADRDLWPPMAKVGVRFHLAVVVRVKIVLSTL